MDFNISTDSIQRAIKVLGVVVRANAVDATGRILIEAANNEVMFTANNGATAMSFIASEVEIIEPGEVAIAYSKIKLA